MEHLLGKGIERLTRLRHSRRIQRWKAGAEPFVIKEHTRRFSLLASIIAERHTPVLTITGDTRPRPYYPILAKVGHAALLPDHGFAWSDNETIFLPLSLVEMQSLTDQERLAKTILFFLSYQIKCGSLNLALKKTNLLKGDQLLVDLYWIVENTRLHALIRRDFPGALANFNTLCKKLIKKRPGKDAMRKAEWVVEDLLRSSLRGGTEGPAPACAEGSFSIAIDIKERLIKEGLKPGRYRALVPFVPWGKLIPARIKAGVFLPPRDVSADGSRNGDSGEEKRRGDTGAGSRYTAKKEQIDEEANEQGLMLNIYDKLLSWADFVNVPRPFDDDPDSDNDSKASSMEELTVADVSRGTRNMLNAELEKTDEYETGGERRSKEEGVYTYREWDYRRQAYREDFSRVRVTTADIEDGEFAAGVLKKKCGVIRELRRQFEMLTPEVRFAKRQTDGDLIDIDAVVEAMGDITAGRIPDEKLYIRYNRAERDLSALFLVDLSMSTDTWVGGGKVIDHEKEALIILCEALERLKDRYAIYGFSGRNNTRCRFFNIKGFDEGYSETVKSRIGGLTPLEYTRMGPALRHASGILKRQASKVKLLFILSDGKPNDVDCYEGRYGVEDTRMAVKECEKDGIIPFCLTVDTNARDYLPRVFGNANYAVLPGAERLTRALPELYARIVRRL